MIHFGSCNYSKTERFHIDKLYNLLYCKLYTVLHVSAVRCHQIYWQLLHTAKTRISDLHKSVYDTWILAMLHCTCVWHMHTGNTALYVCMTHGYWQYCTVRVYETWILAILHCTFVWHMDTGNTALNVDCLFNTNIHLHKHASTLTSMESVHGVLTLMITAIATETFRY